MSGDDHTRHCAACDRDVHDLSAMTREELSDFLEAPHQGRRCVRFFRRPDGTVMTSDCPLGVRARHTKRGLAAAGISTAAIAVGLVLTQPVAAEAPTGPPSRAPLAARTTSYAEPLELFLGELEEPPPPRRHRRRAP